MHLDLAEKAAALTKELDDIVENDRYPVLAPRPHPESGARQAQAGAGPRAHATAEGLCAAASHRH
jgi:hypothetical protein